MAIALAAILIILAIAWGGALIGLKYVLGVVLPMLALIVFIIGFIMRLVYWAKSPVPFAIPTTGGQEKSLDWIKPARLDTPTSTMGLIGRMALEIFAFRSLFRNTRAVRTDDNGTPRITYYSSKWLWLFALLFHYSMLVIIIRHARCILEPVPFCINAVEFLDGLFQVGTPRFFISNALILAGLGFLLLRRLCNERLRYLSLPADYFALFLLLAVVCSGICMRYIDKVDIAMVKVVLMGLVTFNFPSMEQLAQIGPIFFIHVTFVSVLLIYFPFSKLMHMGGIFFSPTRNLKCNTREVRHINPWNPPKKFHTYAAYEDDFRELMVEAGLPVDKPLEEKADEPEVDGQNEKAPA